jgi:hypothetical protein
MERKLQKKLNQNLVLKTLTKYFSIFLFALFILATSCVNQKYYAWKFIKQPDLQPVLIISNPLLYKIYNEPDANIDSLMRNKPQLIHNLLDDTTLLNLKILYDSALFTNMRQMGFEIYTEENITDFFALGKPAWQLIIKQITFEEYRFIHSDDLYFPDYHITYDTILSDFEMNVWLDFSPVNNDTLPKYRFFSSFNVTDIIKGRFVYDRIDRLYRYDYSFYPVIEQDFFDMAQNSGLKHAQYIFDFFMNQFVFFNYKKASQTKEYLTFDRDQQKIIPANTKRFIFLSDE